MIVKRIDVKKSTKIPHVLKIQKLKQSKNQIINKYIIYFKNIESNIVTFSEKQKIHFFFHELNQKVQHNLY